jgi:hypothetical protein
MKTLLTHQSMGRRIGPQSKRETMLNQCHAGRARGLRVLVERA